GFQAITSLCRTTRYSSTVHAFRQNATVSTRGDMDSPERILKSNRSLGAIIRSCLLRIADLLITIRLFLRAVIFSWATIATIAWTVDLLWWASCRIGTLTD